MDKTPSLFQFSAKDLGDLNPRETNGIAEAVAIGQMIQEGSTAFTARLDGRVIGCAGVFKRWEGTGQAWVMISEEMMNYKMWFHRSVWKLLKHVAEAERFCRIEAVVLASSPRNIRWLETLGFSRETPEPMRHYRREGDYYLYSLTED